MNRHLVYSIHLTYAPYKGGYTPIPHTVMFCDCHDYLWRSADLISDDMGRSIICPITRWMSERPNDFYPGLE